MARKKKAKAKATCKWGRVTRGPRKGRCRKSKYVRRAKAASRRTTRRVTRATRRVSTRSMIPFLPTKALSKRSTRRSMIPSYVPPALSRGRGHTG